MRSLALLPIIILAGCTGGLTGATAPPTAPPSPTPPDSPTPAVTVHERTVTVNSTVVRTRTVTVVRTPTPTPTPTPALRVEPPAVETQFPLGRTVATYNVSFQNRSAVNTTRWLRQIAIAMDYYDDDYRDELPVAYDFADFERVAQRNATIQFVVMDHSTNASAVLIRNGTLGQDYRSATIYLDQSLPARTVGWWAADPLAAVLYNGKPPYHVRTSQPTDHWWVKYSD